MCVLTVSSGCVKLSLSSSRIKNTTNGYARRGGAPNTSGGFGDFNLTTISLCGDWPL